MPAPESLEIEKAKKSGTYNTPEVVERLKDDFDGKCYLCELKPLMDFQIEHLKSHHNGKDRDLEFDWNNLFLACPHCNKEKNKREYDIGIIDCCLVDPEILIKFNFVNQKVVLEPADALNDNVSKTIKLLDEIYNDSQAGMKVYESKARTDALKHEMNRLFKALSGYKNNPDDKIIKRYLQVLLGRKSAFAAFKRQYVRDNAVEYDDLVKYLDD
ncbi:HNH endonuclease [Pseudobutyrivibrio xylanivorans]|uniref:TIGR02646 family protein n=1 Tax=Pseudobutyrivibrio xylanivorans DSM 14809 TaxID=1123012 RepID=A0A1M6KP96_PSEXY|nr:HNH endonuclease [Pseudobutyrivibrio xylanivorans]SHJ60769.1 TIGR02646 family protein [Pseudobutyrivibrio xylanivorans DSM 14809]